MTTEGRRVARGVALALPAAALGWLTLMLVLPLFSDAAPGAVAFFPAEGFVARLPEDVALVSAGPLAVTVRSERAGLAAALYRAGARVVLPAGLPGCLPLAGLPSGAAPSI